MAAAAGLAALRRRVARIERGLPRLTGGEPGACGEAEAAGGLEQVRPGRFGEQVLSLGTPDLDKAFHGGGLPCWGTHEVAGADWAGAALGFSLGLLARLLGSSGGARAVLVQERMAEREGGGLYGPGLQAFGLDPGRLLLVSVRRGREALWATEEVCRSGAAAAVLTQIWDGEELDLQATRRFNLAARRTATMALLVTRDLAGTSAALTRWRIAGRPSRLSGGLLGRPAMDLSLIRNRQGRTGAWTVEWSPHDRAFLPAATHPLALAGPPFDQPIGAGAEPRAEARSRRALG